MLCFFVVFIAFSLISSSPVLYNCTGPDEHLWNNDHCYKYFSNRRNQVLAELECQSWFPNAHLFSLLSEDELAEILSIPGVVAENFNLWVGLVKSGGNVINEESDRDASCYEWLDHSIVSWPLGYAVNEDEAIECFRFDIVQLGFIDRICSDPFGFVCKIVIPQCAGILASDPNVCQNHGECIQVEESPPGLGFCDCDRGFPDCGELPPPSWVYWAMIGGGAGGGVAVVLALMLLISLIVICCVCRRRKRRRTDKGTPSDGHSSFHGTADDQVDQVLREESRSRVASLRITESLFEIEYSSLQIQKSIGQGGSNATVFLAEMGGETVAFKCFQLNDFDEAETFASFENEGRSLIRRFSGLLRLVMPLTVCRFYGATLSPPRVGIVMEYCENGDMDSFLASSKKSDLSQALRFRILRQVCAACAHLHGLNVIHRDLKPGNVLLDSGFNAKLTDFGLSKLIHDVKHGQGHTSMIGTSFYMAPEIVVGGDYDASVDVFAFAIMIFGWMTHQRDPYINVRTSAAMNIEHRVASDPAFRPAFGSREEEASIPRSIVQAMRRAWSHDPKARPSFSKLFEILRKAEYSGDCQL